MASQLRYLKSQKKKKKEKKKKIHASVSFTKIKNAILSILRKSHTPGSSTPSIVGGVFMSNTNDVMGLHYFE